MQLVLHKCKQDIKTNYTEHISLKLFYPHELQEGGDISIL
jgi:hypothetical protein